MLNTHLLTVRGQVYLIRVQVNAPNIIDIGNTRNFLKHILLDGLVHYNAAECLSEGFITSQHYTGNVNIPRCKYGCDLVEEPHSVFVSEKEHLPLGV